MAVKSAIMVSPFNIRVATTSGHVINFKAGEPTYVAASAVTECRKYGVRETQRVKGTDTDIPGVGTLGEIKSDVSYPDLKKEELVEEVDLEEHIKSSTGDDAPKRNAPTYTESEVRIRTAINTMVSEPHPDDFAADGKPKVAALNRYLQDMTASAGARDRVWDKMVDHGEIPEEHFEG